MRCRSFPRWMADGAMEVNIDVINLLNMRYTKPKLSKGQLILPNGLHPSQVPGMQAEQPTPVIIIIIINRILL